MTNLIMETKNRLSFCLKGEEGGDGELFIRAEARAFSGAGSAWFNLTLLASAIDSFGAYPIDQTNPPVIQGGYFDASGNVDQEHLFLSVIPNRTSGELALVVRLATPIQEHWEHRFSFSGEYKTDYEQLAFFMKEFKRLVCAGNGSFHLDECC